MKKACCVMMVMAVSWLFTAPLATLADGFTTKALPGHVPKIPAGLAPKGQLPETNQLWLAIGLGLRDQAGLDALLDQLYQPDSPNFRHYLTPEEFTARFGPTPEDYQAVLAFARSNGLNVAATHPNRLLLDVQGSVRDIQRAFHLTLRTYRHPSEERDFFAPDAEPTVDAHLPVADISGLDNYVRPHPKSRKRPASALATPRTGSSPDGSYLGRDFRAAYLPGVSLTGTGQMLGLLEFDGFYTNDISAYATAAGLATVPMQTVLLDGYNGVPTTGADSGNPEVSLDIELALAMAPGLAKIVVFEVGPYGAANDCLNAMASSNQIKQFSCSWGWGYGPSTTTDTIFKQMASQGQSFFNASGDSDAFTTGASSVNGVDNTSLYNAPSSNPYITQVGGTTLTTTGPGGAWASETVWNWGLQGSSGGVSSYYSLPTWQSGVSMSGNGGSTAYRNIPDVALTADNVYVIYGNGVPDIFGGTSCAAPLWAGLAALANQQAAGAGRGTVGFVNPALYAVGKGPGYSASFHDITSGNNVSSDSPSEFYATAGYDLCTGWGTPRGQALIDTLAGPANPLSITPLAGFAASGPVGGPFAPSTQTCTLTNTGASSLAWSLINTSAWLAVAPGNGTLAPHAAASLLLGLASAANSLTPGAYQTSLLLSNDTGDSFAFSVSLGVGQSIIQNGGFETGDFTGWSLVGNTVKSGIIYNAVENSSAGFTVVHSGTYGAFLGDAQIASLSQMLVTVPGQYYLLSFWLDNPSSGTGQSFSANWNTNGSVRNPVFSLSSPAAFSWTNLQFIVRAAGTNTTLQLQAENDPNYFGLDDVRVTPLPLPKVATLARSNANVQVAWTASTGLVYQLQYKTNLLQTNWLNLRSLMATNYSLLLVDTNAAVVSPQRFYRLTVLP